MRKPYSNLIKFFAYLFIFLAVIFSSLFAYTSFQEFSKYLGLKKTIVPVVGTGSMYPSLFWAKSEQGPDDLETTTLEEYRTTPLMYRRFHGLQIFGHTYLYRQVQFGDMVAFKNDATRSMLVEEGKDQESGFIKRILGLPGDTIEFRDGYLLRNGERLEEPYIYRPRSSYGQESVGDCEQIVVPASHYFVLGDNRKISADSRSELSFIADSDINFILPFDEQAIYHSLWRDTSQDEKLLGTPTLESKEFYRLLNLAREKVSSPTLTPNNSLVRSSSSRGKEVLSSQPSTLENSLKNAGYSNIVTGEFMTRGHFTAEELIQNLLYFPSTASQVLDSKYQDIGISVVNKEVNGCPTQIIVGELGGYIPASYSSEVIKSWQDQVSSLEAVIPSWEKARQYSQIDQTKLEELLSLLYRRLDFARAIVSTMQDNKWLTEAENQALSSDEADASRASELSNELNKP